MAGFAARAAAALRDPWSILVTAIGAGSAWAVELPVAGVVGVGVGMLGVAALVGGALAGRDGAGDVEIELQDGTTQKQLVDELTTYRRDLVDLQRSALPPVLASSASDAVSAADRALKVALQVAGAVDALDLALSRAGSVQRRMPGSGEVRGSIDRMVGRRQGLLNKLAGAVNGIGEVYTGLLELSTTAAMAGMGTGRTRRTSTASTIRWTPCAVPSRNSSATRRPAGPCCSCRWPGRPAGLTRVVLQVLPFSRDSPSISEAGADFGSICRGEGAAATVLADGCPTAYSDR